MKKISMLERFAAQSLVEYEGELIFSKEKFAELIVRECINQCAHAPDVSEDWYRGVKWVANEIAQHFGVEE